MIVVTLLVGVSAMRFAGTQIFDMASGLPSCTSTLAEKDVARTVENSPAGHTKGVRVIRLEGPRLIRDEAGRRVCAGLGRLNSGDRVDLDYEFVKNTDRPGYLVEVHPVRPSSGTASPTI